MKSYYRIDARGPQSADIRIDGRIGESFFEESVTAKQFVADLDALTAQRITLYINSPGGSVPDASAILSALHRKRASGTRINVVIDGWALSAASLIAMAGETIQISRTATMMLHNPRTDVSGDAATLRKTADVLDKLRSGMAAEYDARLKIGTDAVYALLDAETWYSAQEAVSAGLADEITHRAADPSPIPRSLNAGFSFIPAAYAVYQEPVMTDDVTTPEQPVETPEVPVAAETPTPEAIPPAAISDAEFNARVDAAVSARQAADRARIKAIRAAFAPWLKRGYALGDLQANCEDEFADLATVNARILAALGGMAEPLGGGQGACAHEADITAINRKILNKFNHQE
jgi:ATP-dependent protease ClpP protease subunit